MLKEHLLCWVVINYHPNLRVCLLNVKELNPTLKFRSYTFCLVVIFTNWKILRYVHFSNFSSSAMLTDIIHSAVLKAYFTVQIYHDSPYIKKRYKNRHNSLNLEGIWSLSFVLTFSDDKISYKWSASLQPFFARWNGNHPSAYVITAVNVFVCPQHLYHSPLIVQLHHWIGKQWFIIALGLTAIGRLGGA